MVAELGGAQGEAGEGGRGGHVRVRGREGRLELVGVVAIAGLVVRVDGRRGEELVRSRVVGADAQGHLVHYGATLGVGETVAVLEESGGRRAGGQDGVEVVSGSGERAARGVLQQGMRGQALGVRVWGGRGVRGAAVRQVGEGVRVDRGGDVGVRPQRPIVAVPLFVVRTVQLHLSKAQRVLLLAGNLLLPGQEGVGWEEGEGGGSALLSYEAAAPIGPGPGL